MALWRVFSDRDWLYYFLRVERSAWCISIWISDLLWWWQWNPEWGFILFSWYFSLILARLHLRSPGSGVVLDPRLLWLTMWPCYRHFPLPLLRNFICQPPANPESGGNILPVTKMYPPHMVGSSFEDSLPRIPGHFWGQGAFWRKSPIALLLSSDLPVI